MKALHDKAIDVENCLHHNHLQILGLPETAEGSRPAEFTEQFLSTLLGLENLLPSFVVEQAHRVPPTSLIPGAPLRPFLLKRFNYLERDMLLARS